MPRMLGPFFFGLGFAHAGYFLRPLPPAVFFIPSILFCLYCLVVVVQGDGTPLPRETDEFFVNATGRKCGPVA